MIGVIWLVILSLLALSVLVVVHELGHFIVAKKAGVLVEEFGIGLPPRVWGKKIGETFYSINAIPLGGFVRLHGETGSDEIYEPGRAFINKHPITKSLIVIAGIVMNFVFGIICFSVVYSFLGIDKVESLGKVEIVGIAAGSPAQTAGILSGDIVKSINDNKVLKNGDFINLISENRGKKINLVLQRDNEEKKFLIILKDVDPKEGALGVEIRDSVVKTYYPPLWQRPFVGGYYGLIQSIELSRAIILGLGGVASEASKGKIPEGVVGPVGLIAIIAYFVEKGLLLTINLVGIISINLAIFNILPIPPLDGSRLAIILGETLFGRKLRPKIESWVHGIGMALLLLLVVLVTFREIPSFISAGTLAKFVESVIK